MDKKEILQASRNENQNKDIYELEIIRKGQRIGGLISVSVAFILLFVEDIILDMGINCGYLCIIFSMEAGLCIYKAEKLKRKHEILLAVLFSAMFIFEAIMLAISLKA